MKKASNPLDIRIFFVKKFKVKYDIKKFIKKIIESEKKHGAFINLIFVDDKKIKQINADFRFKNSETDVISFTYNEKKYFGGDIFISVDTARNNAKKYNVDFEEEIMRLVAHGVLHVLGYDHTNIFGKTEEMRKKQEKYVKKFLKEY